MGVGEIIITDISREGKNKGFDIEFYKKLRSLIKVQLIAHGGAGPLENLANLFKISNVDGVSIASLFHYNYLKLNKKSKPKASNFFLQSFDDNEKKGVSISELKKYLISQNIKVRI